MERCYLNGENNVEWNGVVVKCIYLLKVKSIGFKCEEYMIVLMMVLINEYLLKILKDYFVDLRYVIIIVCYFNIYFYIYIDYF